MTPDDRLLISDLQAIKNRLQSDTDKMHIQAAQNQLLALHAKAENMNPFGGDEMPIRECAYALGLEDPYDR